jgi:hypothetical protein
MSNWKDWIDGEDRKPMLKKRINKYVYCKKNKVTVPPTRGITFGPHVYENGSKCCKLCGHKKKEFTQYDQEPNI